MANNESDADATEDQKRLDEYQRRSFQLANLSPISWMSCAERHKRAADALYEIVHRAQERDAARPQLEATEGNAPIRLLEGEELEDYNDRSMLPEYLLLLGYALECLTKGYLLATRPGLLKDGVKLDKFVATHSLTDLFERCGIAVNEEEDYFLKVIGDIVEWGKYPATRSLDKWPKLIDRGFHVTNPYRERRLKNLLDGLYVKAERLLGTATETKN